jgi:hypothetical protein
MTKLAKKQRQKGPTPDRVKVSGDWTDAIKKALEKPRPPQGWPEQPRYAKKK